MFCLLILSCSAELSNEPFKVIVTSIGPPRKYGNKFWKKPNKMGKVVMEADPTGLSFQVLTTKETMW
ncbi:hypothetical protein Y032_0064g3505 [Ancylostoma ceylanicum]|uniref:Uncharacterized protein n=1 Tax=Ancylostoma ceylanicum TaxID=53326 RepID=A0A016U163_9BILA|nr:hypothetical protein Y032_0064g3505 [Ancylostoma ceylanicum]